jgi:hypothetical protein
MTANQLERFARAHRQVTAADDDARVKRRLAWRFEDDGSLAGTFRLPPLADAVLLQALRAATGELGQHSHDEDGDGAGTGTGDGGVAETSAPEQAEAGTPAGEPAADRVQDGGAGRGAAASGDALGPGGCAAGHRRSIPD